MLLTACTCADGTGDDDPSADAGRDAALDGAVDAGADADASPGPCDEPCPGTLACCEGVLGPACRDLETDPESCGACGARCPAEAPLCRDGQCETCESIGQTTCEGACVLLAMDDEHCGACAHACADDEQCIDGACQGGECVRACTAEGNPDAVCCYDMDGRGVCTDLRNDDRHCGACGITCGSGGRCDGGRGLCVCDEEPLVVALCDGACIAVDEDEANCGDCGIACPVEAPACMAGHCVNCAALGLLDCGPSGCVDPQTDERACGDCGQPCAPGQECLDGGCIVGDCELPCDDALDRGPICCRDEAALVDVCTSLLVDPDHCGACGQSCGEAGECADGACLCAEGPSVGSCDGLCVDLETNPDHCGACGQACPEDAPRCVDEQCTTCEAQGLTECGGSACADTKTDAANCGGCTVACAPDQECVQGDCVGGECRACDEDVGVCCLHPDAEADPGCADLSTDVWNCGACGVWCAEGEACVAGACVP